MLKRAVLLLTGVMVVSVLLANYMLKVEFKPKYYHHERYESLISYSVSSSDFKKNGFVLFLKDLAEELEQFVVFKNWKLRLYHDGAEDTLNALKNLSSLENIQLYDARDEPTKFTHSYILPLGNSTVDNICYRDKNLDLTVQEAIMIKRWLITDKPIYVLRDQNKSVRVWCFRNRQNLDKGRKALSLVVKNRNNTLADANTLLPNEIWNVFGQTDDATFEVTSLKTHTCNGKAEDERIHKHTYCNSDSLRPHQKVISYSLFGNGTRWNGGGLKYRNSIKLILDQKNNLTLYKDWIIRIYHDGGSNAVETRKAFGDRSDIQFCNVHSLKQVPGITDILGTFYRIVAIGDPDVDISCYRDLDSELTTRETAAVSTWLNSTKAIHLMRDHVWHDIIMLGGMWCYRNHQYREKGHQIMKEVIQQAQGYKGRNDQAALNKVFWKHFKVLEDTIQHDSYMCRSFPGTMPFPTKREDINYFVGCDDIPCRKYKLQPCPVECRPKDHKDWTYC